MTTRALLLSLITASCLMSCTTDTEELKHKLKERNESYIGRQERWQMRKEARQERTDAWFKRWMD